MPEAEGSVGPARAVSVMVAESDAAYRALIRQVCEASPWLEISVEAADADEALSWWERPETTPDLVVLDLSLPGADGLELARKLVSEAPGSAFLGVAAVADDRLVLECLRAGVSGLVERTAGAERLSDALLAL